MNKKRKRARSRSCNFCNLSPKKKANRKRNKSGNDLLKISNLGTKAIFGAAMVGVSASVAKGVLDKL